MLLCRLVALAALALAVDGGATVLYWSSSSCFDGATAPAFGSSLSSSDIISDARLAEGLTLVIKAPQVAACEACSSLYEAAATRGFGFTNESPDSFVQAWQSKPTLINATNGQLSLDTLNIEAEGLVVISVDQPIANFASELQAFSGKVAERALRIILVEADNMPTVTRSMESLRQRRDTLPTPPASPSDNYITTRIQQRHEVANQWFSIPILMGLIIGIFIISLMLVGIWGLFATQTMERWPDANTDKNIQVPQ
ncbi:uncharacterized protein MONBRDRAFT_33335 [Monosiga brevicollis MX1]|uniref:V-type proton ATPase subunit S1/VOA1 transmembrane domain-containing protein n=1 Tax=Monosiga brevicollis TaxID=81824 RepID=A9V4T4_MONBE|nr:uncharacterized protein MONBRDRAFT_33335 [Monosiga brevicollis MX1]EDQ87511.1 predicted protein [Monosiga brevicollis MX1]|eukprot:XP_001747771.1 hypothetical protein [Monosiga brevicollis MX1]